MGCTAPAHPRVPSPAAPSPRASQGYALAPGAPGGVARAERRRGRGLVQGFPGLAAGRGGGAGQGENSSCATPVQSVRSLSPAEPQYPTPPLPYLRLFIVVVIIIIFLPGGGLAVGSSLQLPRSASRLPPCSPFPRCALRPRRCASFRTCAPSPSTPRRAAPPPPTAAWAPPAAASSRSPWWAPAAWARPHWWSGSSPNDSSVTMREMQVHENSLSCSEQLNRCIRWADAVVIVFSITDYKSYELISQLHQHVQQLHLGTRLPVVVVANKADLLHIKQVDPQLGLQLAGMLGCSFYEVSVSENYNDVYSAFHVLCKEVSHKQQPSSTPEKRRTSLIPRPKSPNMQDLKRRFKQALSAKVRTVTSV
uniref:small monomeric GTPase n=1 Tax=Callithrix jacchus TaxID=9483 RepID=A0A8I3W4M1_CALJA